jgi:outer membrane translocation and assembly module TamA
MVSATIRMVAMRCSIVVVVMAGLGCHAPLFPLVPGHTEISVSSVEIEPRTGERLEVEYEELLQNLGLRAKNAIRPERLFNPFRLAEDRRRIGAHLEGLGHFDAIVDEPELKYSPDHKSVIVIWRVHEGVAYRISSVEIVGAPPEHAQMLRAMVMFKPGDRVDVETFRPLRRTLAERLQDEGYGHARGYSRTFVDREKKTVAWFYYLDPGPRTRIGALTVEGNHQVPADEILARTGLSAGEPYSTTAKRRAELALLDTGAFASAIVLSDADIQSGPPEHPDTGGVLASEQVSGEGALIPRQLPDSLAVRVIVVEAPRRQLRLELGIEGDPTRIDSYIGARALFRNLFGPQHHLVLEGHVGYGWLVSDDKDFAEGIYGSALAQYLHPGFIARNLDLRITTRWRDVIYPSALLREVVAGPGVRSTVARGVFVDFDAFYRFGRQIDFPQLDPMSVGDLRLPTDNDSSGLELEGSVIADRRNDRVEPTDGWMLALRSTYSPGGALADHRWLQVMAEARGFVPLDSAWSIGARASTGWVLLPGDTGVPLGPRLFGGGTYGMRGFGRDHLSPVACAAMSVGCDRVLVGGRSLVESSVELRFLPFRKQYGLATFVDAGAAGAGTNAFVNGISVAAGLGLRLRIWYLPISVDVAYRFMDDTRFSTSGGFDRLLVFFRVGEAF